MQEKGRAILETVEAENRVAILVIGRPYHADPGLNHGIPEEFQVLNVLSTAGASVLGFGYLIPMSYLVYSLRYGAVASDDPWKAQGLEWQTSSPPPTENFHAQPIVTSGPDDETEEAIASGRTPALGGAGV